MKNNPYIAGNPVGGASAFIGRADVLRNVLLVLRSESENGMVLYGQRRIGKTSVLQELAAVLPKNGNFAPVYFDLQDKAALSLDQVLTELSNRILYTLDIPEVDIPKEDFSAAFRNIFLPHVLSHLPEQTALVLLLDEFDVLDNPGNKQAGAGFFPYLRDLMAKDLKRLQFVFVIGRRPEDLASVYLSLFKGVKSSHVSLMSEKDTADLVRLSEKNDSLKWTDDVAAEVYQLTGGHPFLTQQLCQVIWNNMYEDETEDAPTVRSEDVRNSVREAIGSATNSLEWLWNGLQPAQRIVASALAEAGPELITQQELEKHLHDSGVRILIGELRDAPKVLGEWDVIQPEDGGYRMRVEMLRQWIAERKPLSRIQDEMDRVLPHADDLFKAAYGYYLGRQLKKARTLLQEAVRLNPNHIKANQLLADIFIAKGGTDEALKILETLYEYNPSVAKHRLVQVLMNKAQEAKEDEQLSIYERILKIDPNQPDSIAKIEKVNNKLRIETKYHQALSALEGNEKEKAQKLLIEVLSIEPSYKEATRYMHLAVTNDDIISLKNKIEELESKLKDEQLQETASLKKEIDNTTADYAQSVNSKEANKKSSKMAIYLKSIFKGSLKRFFFFGVIYGISLFIAKRTDMYRYADYFLIPSVCMVIAIYQIFALIAPPFWIYFSEVTRRIELEISRLPRNYR